MKKKDRLVIPVLWIEFGVILPFKGAGLVIAHKVPIH
jgi:hypothetical protein